MKVGLQFLASGSLREGKSEDATLIRTATFDPYVPPMSFYDVFGYRETDSTAAAGSRARLVYSIKAVEDVGQMLR